MRLFLSYRRDDTGGRAGRLFDALVSRYGRDHVFHDVNTVEPGLRFVQQVEVAIRRSDVVLVVIGPGWLASPAPDGGRRIDREDDYVRRELSVALESNVRVVPVLVDGAALPLAGELPDALVPLLERHAVDLRDVSWHQDVDDLINRLEGEPRHAGAPRQRRTRIVGVAALGGMIAVIAVVAVAVSRHENDGSTWIEPPACAGPRSSWTSVPLADDPSIEVTFGVRTVRVQVEHAYLLPDEDGTTPIVLDLLVTNATDGAVSDAELGYYFSYDDLDGVWVDGVASETVRCFNTRGGNAQLAPTQSVPVRIGYGTERETDGALFQLGVAGGALAINA